MVSVFTIVLLIVFVVTQKKTTQPTSPTQTTAKPTSVPLLKQKPGAPPTQKDTIYTLALPSDPPKDAWVYNISTQKSTAPLLIDFIHKIGLPDSPVVQKEEETLYTWSNNESSVMLNENPSSVLLQYQQLKGGIFKIGSQTENGIREALFVMFPFLPKDISVSGSFQPYENIHILFQNPQPTLIIFKGAFTFKNGGVMFSDSYSSTSLTLTIDDAGYVRTLSVTFPPLSYSPIEKRPIVSLETALDSLNKQKGALSSVSSQDGEYLVQYPKLKTIQITSYAMGYTNINNALYPLFLFKGTGLSEEQKEYNVEISLRATE